jgi:methyl-accepting chemotaxis protein
MQNEILSVIMNGLMAGLLLATIIYCLKLNSRIRVLQDSKSELARIIREFDESTQRATQNINEIHAATMRISENIQHKIDKANYLADDLEMLLEKGNKMAGKVDAPPVRPARVEPTAQRGESSNRIWEFIVTFQEWVSTTWRFCNLQNIYMA